MNKKVFAIVLIVCLAFGVAFAAKQGDIKVGAQVGYGADFIKLTQSDEIWSKTNNGGFYYAGTGEYSFSDALSAKLEVGLNTMGKAQSSGKVLIASYDDVEAGSASPLMFSVYAGANYNFELTDEINLAAGAGVDMMIGKESNADDAKTNAAIGLGLEVVGSYAIQDNLAITLGAKFGWHFINTDDDIKEGLSAVNSILSYFTSNEVSVGHTSLKFFAGATYTL